jgi:hypothetical protein
MAATGDDPLRKLSESSGTVMLSLPVDDLRADGIEVEDGQLEGANYAKVSRTGEREYTIKLLDL